MFDLHQFGVQPLIGGVVTMVTCDVAVVAVAQCARHHRAAGHTTLTRLIHIGTVSPLHSQQSQLHCVFNQSRCHT